LAKQNRSIERKVSDVSLARISVKDLDILQKSKLKRLWALGLLGLQGKFIIDVGCGPSTYGLILAEEGNDVVGIDISRESIKMAKKRAQKPCVSFQALVADLYNLPFNEDTFDICFCGWVLHHLPSLTLPTKELKRILKAGGKITIAEPNEVALSLRLSRAFEDMLRAPIIEARIDTPGRTNHTYRDYVKVLRHLGFSNLKVDSCYAKEWPVVKHNLLFRMLVRVRILLFALATKLFPTPLNGPDLLITAVKGSLS